MRTDINQLFSVNKLTLSVSLLSIAVIITTYWSTLLPLHLRWVAFDEAYSHGYMVAAMAGISIAGHLLKNQAKSISSYGAVLLAVLVSLVWLAGFAVQVQLLEQLMLPAIAGVWVLAIYGRQLAIKCLPAVFFLYLVIPIWGFLIDPLRQVTVYVVQFGLEYLSIPALIEGYRISLPSGVLVVAGGCSGLNYLLVSLVVGAYYSYTSVVSWQRRVVIVAIAIAIALVGNWVRVFILVLVGHYSEMQNDLVYNHGFFGWAVYCVFLVGFFIASTALVNRSPHEIVSTLDVEIEANTNSSTVDKTQLISIAIVTLALVAVPLLGRYQSSVGILESELRVKFADLDLVEVNSDSSIWRADYKGYDSAQFASVIVNGREYELTLLTYTEQRQGKELIYYDNRLADELLLRNLLPLRLRAEKKLNQAVVKLGNSSRVVWWGYRVAGQYTGSALAAKILQLPALLQGNPVASLVTLSTECGSVNCDALLEQLNKKSGHLDLLNRITVEI